jgi:uncharacterized repeat protein (TIGR03803 family)
VASTSCADTLTITNLYSFGVSPNAWGPVNTLAQDTHGDFYGTTPGGGPLGCGTVFQLTSTAQFNALVYFSGTNGSNPYGGLLRASDGTFYGTTQSGGIPDVNGDTLGTVFNVSTNGLLTSLVSFSGTNGGMPIAGLTQGSDGALYGTTRYGGPAYAPNNSPYNYGYGTVFKITTDGALTMLASFNGTNGAYPYGALLEFTNGIFYGTTSSGGSNNLGTVFQVDTNGNLTTLACFNGTNGSNPQAALIRGRDGLLYGTTLKGGTVTNANPQDDPTGIRPYGTVFRMSRDGELCTLHSFSGSSGDGYYPYDALLQGTDGCLYGTTWGGGDYQIGVIFRMTLAGDLITLYSFHGNYALPLGDSGQPYAGLVQSGDGYLYGTAKASRNNNMIK